MIHRTLATWQSLSWQEELSQLVTDPRELLERLELDPALLAKAELAHKAFPLRATQSYVNRIKVGDPNDPLLKQILPIGAEFDAPSGYSHSPLQEDNFTKTKGLIHKYHGRVLLVAASQCAINCRYCFRRHFDYQDNTPKRQEWQDAFDYIRADHSIEEVILSGGDPLAISDKQIAWLIEALANIPHVQRLRIHTRLPIVAPARVTDSLLDAVHHPRLQTVMVVHCNHPQEIDDEVRTGLLKLRDSNISMLNQTVLLKGINDHIDVLTALSKQLFSSGVLPYYLHLLDAVIGAAHFEVKHSEAVSLSQQMLMCLPGYLVPKLVREVPNAASKTPIYS
ncbi:MAG: EF-P beta-lysylation protein EpmB [Lentisphaeria bacterium]|jgi:EF-P beta-lysylation protein EpmB